MYVLFFNAGIVNFFDLEAADELQTKYPAEWAQAQAIAANHSDRTCAVFGKPRGVHRRFVVRIVFSNVMITSVVLLLLLMMVFSCIHTQCQGVVESSNGEGANDSIVQQVGQRPSHEESRVAEQVSIRLFSQLDERMSDTSLCCSLDDFIRLKILNENLQPAHFTKQELLAGCDSLFRLKLHVTQALAKEPQQPQQQQQQQTSEVGTTNRHLLSPPLKH